MGGMAEVFKATYAAGEVQGLIAIKRILPQYSADRKLIAMMINEAKLTISLNHPNIVPIYDFGLCDDHYFLAMMYVEGKDLRSIMTAARAKGQLIPLSAALFICAQILEGLDYAHNRRDNFNNPLEIVHRDVSPANIMISPEGRVRILDFGIAKAAAQIGETQAGILKGKFSYMSPEQAHGAPLDRRSDLFSVGVLLWEMLALENLFLRENELKTLEAVRKAKVPHLSGIRNDIPKEFEKLLGRVLHKNRDKRPATAAEMRGEVITLLRALLPQNGADTTRQLLRTLFPRLTRPVAAEERSLNEVSAPVGAAPLRPLEKRKRVEPSYAPLPRHRPFSFPWRWLLPMGICCALVGMIYLASRHQPLRPPLATAPHEAPIRPPNELENSLASITRTYWNQRQRAALQLSPEVEQTLSLLPFLQADRLRLAMLRIQRHPLEAGKMHLDAKGQSLYLAEVEGKQFLYRPLREGGVVFLELH